MILICITFIGGFKEHINLFSIKDPRGAFMVKKKLAKGFGKSFLWIGSLTGGQFYGTGRRWF